MTKPCIAFILACMGWLAPAIGAGLTVVTYPAFEVASDQRYLDLLEILQTALERTTPEFGPFELKASDTAMNEPRYLLQLKHGQSINIAWSSTSREKETDLLPLRIPLRKGILGYRIAFVAKQNQAKIDQVQNLEDLKKLTLGQGTGWGDVKLYEANGIRVKTAPYDNLFRMVSLERFDLFPRGISEVGPEFTTYSKDNPNLAIEQNLLIYYPWPYYFFFNRADTALKNRIESGIRTMMADGSFDALFKKYNGKAIAEAKLKNRRIIKIHNQLLPKETPLQDKSLWFDPTKD